MPPVQKLISYIGLSKQTAKGAAASSPATFGFGVTAGKVFDIPITQDYEDQTLNGGASDRFSPAVNRTDANPAVVFSTRAWKGSIGLLLLGALGADAASGAGPYTHVITPTQLLNYHTVFARYGASEYEKLVDVIIDELTIGWSERQPLMADVSMLGITPTLGTASFTATNDETVNPFLTPIGGTLNLDVGSATPAAAQVKAFSMKIANTSEGIPLSKAITPDDIMPTEQVIEGTVTLVPNDFTDWKKAVTGTGSGTAIQATPVYGSFSMLTQLDANSQLTLAASRAAFLIPFPDSDPKGGPMELECAFSVVRPTDGSAAFTGTVKNATPTY